MKDKINELFNNIEADSVILNTVESTVNPNFYYFAQLSKSRQLSSFCILKKNKKPLIIANILEFNSINKNKNIDIILFNSSKDLINILRKNIGKTTGIDFSYHTIDGLKKLKSALRSTKLVDVSKSIRFLRETKTKEEIKNIRRACMITEETLECIRELVSTGVKENNVALELEYRAKKLGAESTSFPTIVAFGKNSAVPHHRSGETKLKKCDFVLIDFGVVYNGYSSDITRTYVYGKPNGEQIRFYEGVYEAQKSSLNLIKEGVNYNSIDEAASNIIKTFFGTNMIHSLSHGLGILDHDLPFLNNKILKENMCITVEPGYYKLGFGGVRIEDDVIIKKRKAEMLSKAPNKLVEI